MVRTRFQTIRPVSTMFCYIVITFSIAIYSTFNFSMRKFFLCRKAAFWLFVLHVFWISTAHILDIDCLYTAGSSPQICTKGHQKWLFDNIFKKRLVERGMGHLNLEWKLGKIHLTCFCHTLTSIFFFRFLAVYVINKNICNGPKTFLLQPNDKIDISF